MKLSKFTKQIIAVVMAFALILVSNCFMIGTANAAAPSGWSKMIDGTGDTPGGWHYYTGGAGGTHGSIYYDEGANESISMYVETSTNTEWGIQIFAPVKNLTSGTTYHAKVSFTSDKDGWFYAKDDISGQGYKKYSYTTGANLIEVEFTASSSTKILLANFVGVQNATTFTDLTITYTDSWTTAAPTEAPTEEGGFIPIDDGWVTPGNFEIFAGYGGRTMSYKGTGAYNDMHVKMKGTGTSEDWTTQIGINVSGLTTGSQYDFTIVYDSNNAFTMFAQVPGITRIDDISVINGENTFTGTFTAGTNPAHGNIMVFPKNAPDGTIFDFKSVTVVPHGQGPTETSTETESQTQAGNVCTLGAWTFAGENDTGWQYYLHAGATGSTYSGGTDISTPLVINYGTYVEQPDTCQARSPITAVVGGTECTGSITVGNASEYTMQNVQASVYAVDTSTTPYTYTWYKNATEGAQSVPAGGSTTFNFSYTAPDVGYIVYVADTSYSPTAALTFSATHSGEEPTTTPEPTTVHTDPCVPAAWTFTDDPGTSGWQYYVANNDSTYSGGTDISTQLVINYGTYIEQADTCQVRSPITAVVGGTECTGSITVGNASEYTMQNVQASVYAVDTSTTPYTYTWYKNATEGAQSVPAGGSTTFNFSYTAPDIGYIVYVADTSYSPTGELTFSATHDGPYDVSEYKSGQTYTYPEKDGKVFAGWYTDDTYTTPYTETTGYAYAKFIDEKVLTVKFQEKKPNNDAVRFLSTIDSSLDYQSLGFKFTGHYGSKTITEKTKTVNTVYNKITADGQTTLPTVFSPDSAHFFTYTVRNIDSSVTPLDFSVTPFYVTADGTTVEGRTGEYPQS